MRLVKSRQELGRIGLVVLLSIGASVQAARWPNPHIDELESNLYDRRGYNARTLPIGMAPNCDRFLFGPNTGRSNAADWIRAAYHDMATYNIADRSGGLDASIRFESEQTRPENVGDAFKNTLTFITPLVHRHFSLADGLALAMVTAVEICGGPKIPFRGGRVDALKPNSPGVPEPQQTVEEHIASFARQGFSKKEMIGLVACGHSIGGVQHEAFPDVVPPSDDPQNTSGNSKFDSTGTLFDNRIATEYLDGTTTNPLVVGHNSTMNSDLRIFSSDRNVTMRNLANPAAFRSTCSELLARMIDTVPRGVVLTDIIHPIKFKPVGVHLVWVGGGKIALKGEVRVWNSEPSKVVLNWKARDGRHASGNSATLLHDLTHISYPVIPDTPSDLVNRWFSFPETLLNANHGISNFWFDVTNAEGSKKVENLGGAGYNLQDVIMISNTTCLSFTNGTHLDVEFAVRETIKPTRVYTKIDISDDTGRPIIHTIDITPPSDSTAVAGYILWHVTLTQFDHFTLVVDTDLRTFETTFFSANSPFGYSSPMCP
ncbi:putative L-ascorbate oxidase [Cristinia sonorae]|uniref:Peroxidase n=1 Tax=Cristinia sonorae TaxID=1940300 RepID=A0A8K0UQZ5_9AGAR|nr:putative L-ascorbate oxidase [Cristinia sonorae]